MTKRQKRKTARRSLPLTVPFGIPTYWSSETAFAIFEFIDEMRTIMLAAYGTRIMDGLQQQQQNSSLLDGDPITDDEIPF